MKKLPSDIQKWNRRWDSEVVYCRPSGDGAVGVVFVWTGTAWTTGGGMANAFKKEDAAFVIKPIQGSAAPTKFAEHILSKIGGAVSPHSKPIRRRSVHGDALVAMLKKFRLNETDAETAKRWQNVFQHYDQADHFLIQETQTAIREMGDEYRKSGGLEKILKDQMLMINLGKLFAADALIGNGDRLFNMNTGNIIYNAHTKQLSAIDSSTILTNFYSILSDTSGFSNSAFESGLTADTWASHNIVNRGFAAVPSPAQQTAIKNDQVVAIPYSMPTVAVFSVKDWFTNRFRWHFEQNKTITRVDNNVWFQAELWFTTGVNLGIKEIDNRLSGFNWLVMKAKYKNFVSKYGGDPNLDWMNFKIRRKYFKLRKAKLSHEQALCEIQNYVARKMPGL